MSCFIIQDLGGAVVVSVMQGVNLQLRGVDFLLVRVAATN